MATDSTQYQHQWEALGGRRIRLNPDKSPAVPNFSHTLTDFSPVDAWGALLPYGIMVLDVDVKEGKEGELSLRRLSKDHNLPTDTFTVKTPSGGLHIYLSIPDGFKVKSSYPKYPGIDIKGPGATGPWRQYVVGPGSYVQYGEYSGTYDVLRGRLDHLQPCPSSMLPFIEASEVERPTIDLSQCNDSSHNIDKFYVALDLHQRQHGHDERYVAANMGLDIGLSPVQILFQMEEVGFDYDGRLQEKINHAIRYRQNPIGVRTADPREVFDVIEQPEQPAINPNDYFIDSGDMTLEPVRFLIEGIMQPETSAMLVGESGAYKTFIALSMGLSVAYGVDWLGHKVMETGPCIYIAGEGQSGIARRVHAWHRQHGLEIERGKFLMPRHRPMFPSSTSELMQACEGLGVDPAMVILDTVNRTIECEENSADDWREFMQQCADVIHRRWPECVVMVVHHLGKDASKGDRGTSARYASMDHVYEVVAGNGTKLGKMRASKMKDSDDFDPIDYQMKVVPLDLDNSSLVVELADQGFTVEDQMQADLTRLVDLMTSEGVSLTVAAEQVTGLNRDHRTCRNLRGQAIERGYVEKRGRGWVAARGQVGVDTQKDDINELLA